MVASHFTIRIKRKIRYSNIIKLLSTISVSVGLLILAEKAYAVSPNEPPVLGSVSLASFVQQAVETNPAIQAAKANVAAASARHRAADQPLYNPEVTAEAQSAIDKTYSAGINQTVDWTNKRDARAQVGFADAQVAEAQLANLRLQLTADVLNALVAYQANQQVVLLTKERTRLLQQFVTLTQKRYSTGDIARVDVDLALLALSEGLAQQASAEVNLNQALQKLRAITGFNRTQWPIFPPRLPLLQLHEGEVEALLYRLPILHILHNQYLSAEKRIHLAEKQRYPDPTIGVQAGRQIGVESSKPLVGVSVSIPLFIRNTYRAEVDSANFDAIEAGQKRNDMARQARAEIKSSAERYQALYQANQQWQQTSSKPLSDGVELIARLWQAGEISITDYLVQVKQRVDSQIAGVELKGRTWQAWVEWLKSSGQVDTWLNPSHLPYGKIQEGYHE